MTAKRISSGFDFPSEQFRSSSKENFSDGTLFDISGNESVEICTEKQISVIFDVDSLERCKTGSPFCKMRTDFDFTGETFSRNVPTELRQSVIQNGLIFGIVIPFPDFDSGIICLKGGIQPVPILRDLL